MSAAERLFSRLTVETIAHGYLFTGPTGVGKKTFARRLAQSLLCEAPKTSVLGYDGTCASCKLFGSEQTRHPDMLESLGALKIGESDEVLGFHEAEQITSRDLVRQLSLRSYAGGFRVFLLGDVEFASPAAANALLKFFEEPPPRVVVLLTTATPANIIGTIRSRLVEVKFSALSASEVATILRDRGYSQEDATLGASLSQGSVTRALAALDRDEEQLRDQVARWFFATVAGETPDENWATRETLDEGIEIAKTLLRDWLARGLDAGAPQLAVDYTERIAALPPLDPKIATTVLGKIGEAQRLAGTNVSPALVGDYLRMSLARLSTAAAR